MTATQTSIEAFRSIQGPTITGLQLRCLRHLRMVGPCTARELCAKSGEDIPLQKRLPELVSRGLAFRVGERTCSVTGKSATVWSPVAAPTPERSFPPLARSGVIPTSSAEMVSAVGTPPLPARGGGVSISYADSQERFTQLETCSKCGGKWLGGPVHSPHYSHAGVMVDCVGAVVQ
jgi:hypothetical protein